MLSFNVTSHVRAYVPAILSGKYQTDIIDWNFYYRGSDGGSGWLPKLVDYYGGRNDSTAILSLRRAIVPSAMVDWNGDLYTSTLNAFQVNGPRFWLKKHHYNNGAITCNLLTYEPWLWAYGKDTSESLNIATDPNFDSQQWDSDYFKRGFHHALSPCMVQEVETASVHSCSHVRIFHYVPNARVMRLSHPDLPDFEGAFWVSFRKSDFALGPKATDNRTEDNTDGKANCLLWNRLPHNYSEEHSTPFPNFPGNFHGFHLESNPYYLWLFHDWWPKWDGDSTDGIHCIRYSSSDFARKGVDNVVIKGDAGVSSAIAILPRFIKIGSYVYFCRVRDGVRLYLHRILPSQTDGTDIGPVGTLECMGYCVADWYTETTSRDYSYAPYSWDFCILEADGTPSSASSTGQNKILCVFSLGGGGSTSITPSGETLTTYVNWTYNNAIGVVSSYYFNSNPPQNSTSWEASAYNYAQNTIYVTDYTRGTNTYVDIRDTTKEDKYRLYLNSHKMVPYTSPSGKHYLIFAYCYPGKKQHLYLGYAQYFIDSNYRVRLLTKTVFKETGNDGWGDSFGSFTDCTRIISMDLRAGHLWITFVKDSGIDPSGRNTDQRKQDAHFNYFHILVKDLIQE
ncbi:MAG: hypothetical protein ACSW8C_00895 [bacterium]